MLSWSSGKDSAWALHRLRGEPEVEIIGLFTTVNREFDRVAMHGVRRTLLDAQAARVGLPLFIVPLPNPCPNEAYEAAMAAFVEQAKQRGVTHFAFGDLFLEDIRRYREEKLAGTGIDPLFPLWGLPTRELAREMVDGGLRAAPASDRRRRRANGRDDSSTRNSSPRCPSPSTRAASEASSTPSSAKGRCSVGRSRSPWATSSSATASSSPTCCAPFRTPRAEGNARHARRLPFRPGDFFRQDIPQADVVLVGHILHDRDLATKKMLVEKAFDALPAGGALIVYEALIDDNRSQNAFGLMMSLSNSTCRVTRRRTSIPPSPPGAVSVCPPSPRPGSTRRRRPAYGRRR